MWRAIQIGPLFKCLGHSCIGHFAGIGKGTASSVRVIHGSGNGVLMTLMTKNGDRGHAFARCAHCVHIVVKTTMPPLYNIAKQESQ